MSDLKKTRSSLKSGIDKIEPAVGKAPADVKGDTVVHIAFNYPLARRKGRVGWGKHPIPQALMDDTQRLPRKPFGLSRFLIGETYCFKRTDTRLSYSEISTRARIPLEEVGPALDRLVAEGFVTVSPATLH